MLAKAKLNKRSASLQCCLYLPVTDILERNACTLETLYVAGAAEECARREDTTGT